MKKAILCLFLIVCLAVSAVPYAAADAPESDGAEETSKTRDGAVTCWEDVTLSKMSATAIAAYQGTLTEDVILVFHSTGCGYCKQFIPQYRAYANGHKIPVVAYAYVPNSEEGTDGDYCSAMWRFVSPPVGWPIVVSYNAGTRKFTARHSVRSMEAFISLVSWLEPDANGNPFQDVKQGSFYYDAVLWALNADPQVTAGISSTRFSPNADCTRAQVVTFLWRAKGAPEPESRKNPCRGDRWPSLQSSNDETVVGESAIDVPFNDVKATAYYYKAVLWAVENDITQGTGGGKFSPNASCTRGQVVTFLWRTEGEPTPEALQPVTLSEAKNPSFGEGEESSSQAPQNDMREANPFDDVKTTDYFYTAVLWAVEKGITNGMGDGTFAPGRTCTRGQVVTFLWRDLAKQA